MGVQAFLESHHYNQGRRSKVFQCIHTKANKDFVLITLLLVLIFTSSILQSVRINADQSFSQPPASNNINGKVFGALYSTSTVESTNYNGINHNVVLEEAMLQDGQAAYKMVVHTVSNGSLEIDKTSLYSNYSTIPGPTIVLTEGDKVNVRINYLNGSSSNEEFIASHPGTFVYQDDDLGADGLFGAVIVNPKDGMTQALVNEKITPMSLSEINKDVLLFMVGSTFWGVEMDNNGTQRALWTNPVIGAHEDQKIRFHVIGIGPSANPHGHSHSFHLHAHRWLDPGTKNIIDVKEIQPGKSHVFVVDAGEGVGPGNWQYHCHVFSHMEAGMMSSFNVTKGDPNQQVKSIAGASPYKNFASFSVSDEPGKWFRNMKGDITNTGSESIAVINMSGTVNFMMDGTNAVHTITSIMYPKGAANMPFDQMVAYKGGGIEHFIDPGLYVFACRLHPFMLAAIIVDDPSTAGLDLGDEVSLINGTSIPTNSDLLHRFLRTFLVATSPSNWQDYTSLKPWRISYPDVSVRVSNGTVLNVKDVLEKKYGQDLNLSRLENPKVPGVGELWVDTQFEKTKGKSKPGTATALDTSTWNVTKKVSLPEINMNNPHNMWTDKNQKMIYQTQWFDNRTTVFNRTTGDLVKDIQVGDVPSHVMTGVKTDDLHIALNGKDGITVVSPNLELIDFIFLQYPGTVPTHPHAHWTSADDKYMVTADALAGTATVYNMEENKIVGKIKIGTLPTGVGMTPDGSKSYITDFFDSTISVIDTDNATLLKKISLLENYNPITGNASGPMGLFPIQTPVSPDGQYMVTANTGGTITILDTGKDELVKELPCDAGCHGVNFGAKKGGGYYAYVSSTFSNDVIVVDGDPNNDGNPEDASIAGRVSLVATTNTKMDDKVANLAGTGGQGVLPIPIVYNGWVQNLPGVWKEPLTVEQRDPITTNNTIYGGG
jgi:6-phosphogluconolactonase (cycloisomerase 2 family)